jgi:hypothetical protein
MQQKVSWPLALLILGILLLAVLALGYRQRVSPGAQGRISPEFLKLSPEEQREALANAERLRRLRGAPASR